MGIKLSKADREKYSGKPKAVVGSLSLFLPGDPPTTTHHDKIIARRGNGRYTLVDSPALKAARDHYMRLIPLNTSGLVIAGPIGVDLEFRWAHSHMVKLGLDNPRLEPTWSEGRSDVDNLSKVVCDILAKQGWIANDNKISKLDAVKLEVTPSAAGVAIYARTMVEGLLATEVRHIPKIVQF